MNQDQMALSALRLYRKNARTHSRKQVRQIAKTIEWFGSCNPVLVDDNGLITGHGRVEAATLLKRLPGVRVKATASRRGR
ncbi:MAG: ParB N-terminal domain-containing protein [Terriglobia bacterium]